MSLLTNFIRPLAMLTAITTSSVFAGDIPIDNHTVYDRGDTIYGGPDYEVDRMVVNWDESDQITVDIYTNFASHNNSAGDNHRGGRNIIAGDLLLGTTGSETEFDYAFSLGEFSPSVADYPSDISGGWDNYYAHSPVNPYDGKQYDRYYQQADNTTNTYNTSESNAGSGLYAINNTLSSAPDYHTGGGVEIGQVFGDVTDRNDKAADGTWTVQTQGADNTGFDIFSFSFNVANIEAFQNADQLALSWTMSCYNDVVTALITKDKSTGPVPVPTPASSALILLALALLAHRQHRAVNIHFSA